MPYLNAMLGCVLVKRWLLVLLALLIGTVALAQGVPALRLAGTPYASLSDLARSLGYSVSETQDSLTVRSDAGVLVVFADSPEALWRPTGSREALEQSEVSFGMPVLRQGGRWYAPKELFGLFDMHLEAASLVLPGGRRLALEFPQELASSTGRNRFETVELDNRVYGLSLYASGSAGTDTLSLLLVDAGLLSLALPGQQRDFDAFISSLESGRPLYFIVTSMAESPWETSLTFMQNGRSFPVRHPFSLSILEGEAGRVSPTKPVSGVILLPDWFNLRAPITVAWTDVNASFQFRR